MERAEAIELALHRALRDELHPAIRAIVAAVTGDAVEVRVFHHEGRGFDPQLFEEVIESEFHQDPPSALSPLPKLAFTFVPAETFQVPVEGFIIIHSNAWAAV